MPILGCNNKPQIVPAKAKENAKGYIKSILYILEPLILLVKTANINELDMDKKTVIAVKISERFRLFQ